MSELNERMAKAETTIEHHDRLLLSQIEKNDALTRLTTLMEFQTRENIERDKRQDDTMNRFGSVLENVNDNLDQLNKTQHKMQTDLGEIGNRVEAVEKEQKENTKARTIDLRVVPKKAISWAIGLIGGAVTLYVYIRFGLK